MGLDALDSADRGFLTWVAAMAREPLPDLWSRLVDADAVAWAHGEHHEGHAHGAHLTRLDLSPIGDQLRERVGDERQLTLPLAGLEKLVHLDVCGLQLDALDLAGLPALEVLHCGHNRLKELELTKVPKLRELRCSGNDLMVLDVRGMSSLELVDASGNKVASALLEGVPSLRGLDLSRNQLMSLELPTLPLLENLLLARNALMHLAVPDHLPALEVLDVARNDLEELDLSGHPMLYALRCDRNRLASLEIGLVPRLRDLTCSANLLPSLDLRPAPALERVDARANQLAALRLDEHDALVFLDVSDNRLTHLDVRGAPSLKQLQCSGNELVSLTLQGVTALCQLHASQNALSELDLSDATALADLKVEGNPMTTLDLRQNADLCRLRTDLSQRVDTLEVLTTEWQQHRLVELRRHFGRASGSSDLAAMTPYELHDRAIGCLGDSGTDRKLLDIVLQPHCDPGTALLAYWIRNPRYYLRFATRDDCEPYERTVWDILRTIEDRFARGDFPAALIWFDPRNDKQTHTVTGIDWTKKQPRTHAPEVRTIPERLLETSLVRPPVGSTLPTSGGSRSPARPSRGRRSER